MTYLVDIFELCDHSYKSLSNAASLMKRPFQGHNLESLLAFQKVQRLGAESQNLAKDNNE